MSTEENKVIARTFLEMINEQDLAGYATVCSPEVAEAWARDTPKAYALWGTHHVDVTDMVAEGDKVWCRLATRGGHSGTWDGVPWQGVPPTGKPWTNSGIFFLRLANGKIVEQEGLFDELNLLKQLGATITPPKQ